MKVFRAVMHNLVLVGLWTQILSGGIFLPPASGAYPEKVLW